MHITAIAGYASAGIVVVIDSFTCAKPRLQQASSFSTLANVGYKDKGAYVDRTGELVEDMHGFSQNVCVWVVKGVFLEK